MKIFGSKGQMSDAILPLIIFLILIVGVAVPIAADMVDNAVNPTTINNETQTINATAIPVTLTTDEIPVFDDSESIFVNETGEQLVENTNYTVIDYDAGEFNITDLSNSTGQADGNTVLLVTYDHEQDGFIDNSLVRTLLPFITVAFAIVALTAAFSLI